MDYSERYLTIAVICGVGGVILLVAKCAEASGYCVVHRKGKCFGYIFVLDEEKKRSGLDIQAGMSAV